MTKSKRIDYLDIAKGIGILLVIIGHVSYVSEPVRQYISTFHMPLFFIISGMLIWYKKEEQNSLGEIVTRKIRSLMLPYFVCSICVCLIESARVLLKDANTWENVSRQVFQSLCLQGVSVLWFLPALFMGEIVFICLRKKSSHLITALGLVILLVLTYYAGAWARGYFEQMTGLKAALLYDVVSMILRNLFCVGLVGMGYYFALLIFPRGKRTVEDLLLATGLFVLTAVVLKNNGPVDLRAMTLGNLVWFMVGGVSGSAGVILFSRGMDKLPLKPVNRFLAYLGCHSLLIMVTHLDFRIMYISIIISEWLNGLFFNNNILFCVSIVALVIIMEIAVIFFIKFFGKKLPNRRKQNS